MSDFSVRSDSVDVEQIMEQIRARIREKRGVDYTEQQIRELAAVKLEKFLDPRGVRSDLLTRFKEQQPQYTPPTLPLYAFEDTTLYETHRGLLQLIRRILNPILKLFFNPNQVIHAFHSQAEINRANLEREAAQESRRIEMETLYYELIHNLVFELTRLGIETKNLKMRVESIASRLEFNERRARALESAVVYTPLGDRETGQEPVAAGGPPPAGVPRQAQLSATSPGQIVAPEGPGQRSRRRRRRRGRRGGAPAAVMMGASTSAASPPSAVSSGSPGPGPSVGSDQSQPRATPVPQVEATPAATAAHEATAAQNTTTESVGRAIAAESQPSEPHVEGGPTRPPARPDPDQQ